MIVVTYALLRILTSISTDSDCCTFAPKLFSGLLKNTISRNYKITNKRLSLRERSSAECVIISVAKHRCCAKIVLV